MNDEPRFKVGDTIWSYEAWPEDAYADGDYCVFRATITGFRDDNVAKTPYAYWVDNRHCSVEFEDAFSTREEAERALRKVLIPLYQRRVSAMLTDRARLGVLLEKDAEYLHDLLDNTAKVAVEC